MESQLAIMKAGWGNTYEDGSVLTGTVVGAQELRLQRGLAD